MAEIGVVYGTLSLSAKGVSQQVIGEMGSIGTAGGKQASKGFLSSVGGVVGKVVGVTATGIAAVGGLIGGIAVNGGIEKALAIENAQAKMTGLGHTSETVTTVMDNALSAVKGTAFGLGDAANIASTALASGIKPGAEMSKYLTLVADAAAIAQVPLGEMGQIMGKVTNSGKVTNDVLNQFGDRGVGVLQMLAKEYGVTAEEMTSMVSKGKVDSATFNKVLTENFGGAAKKSGDTTVGAFANMKSALANLGMALSGGFFPLFKSVFNQIQFTLEGITKRIKPAADAFGIWFQGKAGPAIAGFSTFALAQFDKLIVGVTNFVTGFQQGMDNIGTGAALGKLQTFGAIVGTIFHEMRGGIWAFGAAWAANDGDITSSGFPGFMERAAFAVRQLVDAAAMLNFSSVQGFFDSIGPAAGVAGGAFSSIGASLTTLGPAFQEFGAQLPKIAGAFGQLAGAGLLALTAGLSFLADNVDTIIKFMPLIVAGFIAWRVASSGLASAQLAVRASQAAMVPLTTANNILSFIRINQERQLALATGLTTRATLARIAAENGGIVTRGRTIAGMVIQKGAMIAGAAATGIAIAAQWAWNAAMTANPIGLIIAAVVALIAIIVLLVMNWDTVIGFLKGVWDGFVGWFTGIMDGFLSWWGGVWDGFLGFVTPIWARITAIIQVAWSVIVLAVTTYINIVLTIIKTVWNVITTVFSTAWEVIKTIVATALAILISVFTGNFGQIGSLIQGAWSKITGLFSGAFVQIGSIVSGAWSKISGLFTGAVNGIKGMLAGAWNAITNTVSNVWNGIINFFQSIPARIIAGLIALARLHIQMGQWIGSMKDAAVSKFMELVGWVSGVPGRILSALGNVGSLLLGAGQNILSGFLDGLKQGFENVKGFVGGIGQWIADNKGPKPYDLALLVPAGGWIMTGLDRGLRAGIPMIGSTLGDVSSAIESGLDVSVRSGVAVAKAPSFAGVAGWEGGRAGDQRPHITNNFNELSTPRATAYQVVRLQEGY